MGGENQVEKTDLQPNGYREGYATFIGPFNIASDPRTVKGWAEEIARVRGSLHSIGCGETVDQEREREGVSDTHERLRKPHWWTS